MVSIKINAGIDISDEEININASVNISAPKEEPAPEPEETQDISDVLPEEVLLLLQAAERLGLGVEIREESM